MVVHVTPNGALDQFEDFREAAVGDEFHRTRFIGRSTQYYGRQTSRYRIVQIGKGDDPYYVRYQLVHISEPDMYPLQSDDDDAYRERHEYTRQQAIAISGNIVDGPIYGIPGGARPWQKR